MELDELEIIPVALVHSDDDGKINHMCTTGLV